MHAGYWASILLLALVITGCESQSVKPSPVARSQTIFANGLFVHEQSQFEFPEIIGRFRRHSITYFTEKHNNYGVGYNLAHPKYPIVATIYVYPVPDIPENMIDEVTPRKIFLTHYEQQIKEILHLGPGKTLVDDKEVFYGNGLGSNATFQFTGDFAGMPQALRSELFLFKRGPWFLKFRFTTPLSAYDRTRHDIRKMIRAIKRDETSNG